MSQQPPGPWPGNPGDPNQPTGPTAQPGWTPPPGWSPDQPAPYGPAAPPPQYGQPAPPPPQYGQPAPGWGAPPGQGAGWGAPPGPGWSAAWSAAQAPKPGIVALRPLGVGELLDGALGLIRSNPKTVLGLAAAVSAISAVIQAVGSLLALRYLDQLVITDATAEVTVDATAMIGSSVVQIVPTMVSSFLQVLASGLFMVLVGAAVLGRRLDAGQTWAQLRPRLLGLIGLTLLIFLGAIVWIALVIGVVALLATTLGGWAAIPGVLLVLGSLIGLLYVYIRLGVASPALVMEARSPLVAMKRSWALVRGSWWRVLGITILASIITGLLTAVITVPVSVVMAMASAMTTSMVPTVIATAVATLLAGIITLPFGAAVTGLLYTDLRIRREALDIELVSAGVDPSGDPLAPYRRTLR